MNKLKEKREVYLSLAPIRAAEKEAEFLEQTRKARVKRIKDLRPILRESERMLVEHGGFYINVIETRLIDLKVQETFSIPDTSLERVKRWCEKNGLFLERGSYLIYYPTHARVGYAWHIRLVEARGTSWDLPLKVKNTIG